MSSVPTLFSTSLRTILSLAAVIGLIYFFMHILLKLSPGRSGSFSRKNNIIQIVGRLDLSPKKSIYLIRIAKKILVVGVNGGIYLLSTIEDEETVKSFEFGFKSSNSGKFSHLLKNLLSPGGAKINGLLSFGRFNSTKKG